MSLSIVDKILGGVAAPVVDFFKTRQELKSRERIRMLELKDALHARQLEMIKEGLHADMNWEMEFAKQAASSWKDEYTLLVVSIPAVMAFVLHNAWNSAYRFELIPFEYGSSFGLISNPTRLLPSKRGVLVLLCIFFPV